MATAYFYTTAKRHNSTLAPTGGTSYTVNLKGGSDLIDPVFTLNYAGTPNYSMMSFEGRNYFITGIKSVRQDLWEISAHVDVLSTYKTNIQAMSPYVAYYTHSNTLIADKRLSVKATQVTQKNTGSFGYLGKNYCYVLTVIGDNGTAAFALPESDIRKLYAQDYKTVFDTSINAIPLVTGVSVEDVLIDLVRWWKDFLKSASGSFNYAGTISENIRSCHILPVQTGAIGGMPNQDVLLGAIDTLIDGFLITDRTFEDTATVSIPWQANDWRRLAPYHEIYLYIPALGLISLSPSDIIGETSLTVKCSMDVLSGDTIFEVKTSTKTVYYANTNLATQFALGASQVAGTAAANALIAGAGALMGSPLTAAAGVLGLANELQPNPMCIGSNAGGAILGVASDTVECISIFHDTTVSPSSVSGAKGTPHNGVLSLSGVTGYVQTIGASVSGSMTDTERQEINRLMDGGIYIE